MQPYSHKNIKEIKEVFEVNEISKNTYFCIQVKNNVKNIKNLIKNKNFIPNDSHIKLLKEKIHEQQNLENEENDQNDILILSNFCKVLNNLKESDKEKTEYAKKIKEILKEKKDKKVTSLKYIQSQYKSKYKKKISLMTISRILRHHLKMHFRKTTIKNPKLLKENYILMEYAFLIGIIKAVEEKLNLIYIDETGFQNDNNNLYLWRKNNEQIYGGSESDKKKRINLILAIEETEIIIGHYYNNETINTSDFKSFMAELIDKIGDEKAQNSIFIMDNASYHISKEIRKFYKEKRLKILFNCPYKSEFNSIELVFNLIKSKLNKEIFKTQKEYITRIEFLINDKAINNNIKKIYKKTFEKYLEFYINNMENLKRNLD